MARNRLPMAPPTPPGGGQIPWSRVPARLSFAWLVAWAVAWIAAGLAGSSVGSVGLVWVHVGFGGFGFAGHLVVALGLRLDATFNQRTLAPLSIQRFVALPLSLTALLVGIAHHPLWSTSPGPLKDVASWSLLVAAVAFVTAAWMQGRGERVITPNPYAATDRVSALLAPFVIVYFALAAIASPVLGVTHPAVVHLWLAGVIATAVFAVSHRVLMRFSRMRSRPALHMAQAAFAIPGPALLAWGIVQRDAAWALGGAALEAGAILLYTGLVAWAWLKRRGPQPALPLMLVGAVALSVGMVLGLSFLARPDLRVHIPLHAINNLVGFVSLTILGAGSAMLGTGVRPVPGSVNRNVWLMAAGIAVPLAAWEVLHFLDLPGQGVLWASVATLVVHGLFGLKALGVKLWG